MMSLQTKGIPYGHLHAGNVLVVNNVCKYDAQSMYDGMLLTQKDLWL